MDPYAAAGAGGMAGGNLLNVFGQMQGLDAMRDVWQSQGAAQRGFNRDLQQRTEQLLESLQLHGLLGADQGNAVRSRLDAGSGNLVKAIQAQAGRRKGGAAGGVESRAHNTQAIQSTLAQALQSNRVQALLAALQHGGAGTDLLGRQFGQDANVIRGDARGWAALAPMQEQAAQQEGGWARQLGGMFNSLGQAGVAYGMSQPGFDSGNLYGKGEFDPTAMNALYDRASVTQRPIGGWSASVNPYG